MPDSLWGNVASGVAAVASSFAVYLQLRDRRDTYEVRYGSLYPQTSPGEHLYVVNTGKHDIRMLDCGFIGEDGEVFSIPGMLIDEPDEHAGQSIGLVQPHEYMSGFLTATREKPIAAFAISARQRVPRLHFRHEVPIKRRLRIRALCFWYGYRVLWSSPSLPRL